MNLLKRVALDVRSLPLSGVHLIEASAGTGKTYTITSLVLKMVALRGLRIDQILAVTFTNAATSELRQRIGDRLAHAHAALAANEVPESDEVLLYLASVGNRELILRRLSTACRDVDCASVFTIHGFAARVLREFPLESGARMDAELIGDQRSLLGDVVTDFWLSRVTPLRPKEFLAIGGDNFLRRLKDVARVTGGSFDVPRVQLNEGEDGLGAALLRFEEQYLVAREAFQQQKDELRLLLVSSKALNRTKMAIPAIEREFENLAAYFDRDQPHAPLPDFARLTATKVEKDVNKGKVAPSHPLLGTLDEFAQAIGLRQKAAVHFADQLCADLCDEIEQRILKEHIRQGSQSFDSLLSDLCLALRESESGTRLAEQLRLRYPVALIDEFQDTDPTQYEIFERVYLESKHADWALYLIGDPKQSIYAFRGADVFTYLKAGRSVQGDTFTLTTSYRASPALVAAQNTLYQSCSEPFGLSEIVYDEVHPREGRGNDLRDRLDQECEGMRVVYCADDRSDFLQVAAAEIAGMLSSNMKLEGRALRPSDIAVLTRRNDQAAKMQDLLQQLGIAAVMHGDRSVFEAPEALEVRQVLAALSQPKRRGALRSALSTRLFGLSLAEMTALDDDPTEMEQWAERFSTYAEIWRARGIARCFEAMFRDLEIVPATLGQLGGERRLTNLRHLMELLHDNESRLHLGMFGLLRFLEDAIFDVHGHGMAQEARQLRLESDDHAVVLTTMHKSKGLQYNIVVLPVSGMTEQLHSSTVYRYFDPDLGQSLIEFRSKQEGESTLPLHQLEELQEGLRLLYVALTRAKHQVVAFVGEGPGYSSFRYLLFSELLGPTLGPREFFDRSKELKNKDLRSALQELSTRSAHTIKVGAPHTAEELPRAYAAAAIALTKPEALPLISEQESTSSFSGMTRKSHTTLKSRQGRDQLDQDVMIGIVGRGGSPELSRTCVLADFPRGARPGEALHGALELSPFDLDSASVRAEVVRSQLARYGIEEKFVPTAQRAVEDVLQVPLWRAADGLALRLMDLPVTDRFAEMEFSLPVGFNQKRLSVEGLHRAFEQAHFSDSYKQALQHLSFESFSGFLRGFIDLVYVHEGRLYALDYKSNYLGDQYAAYEQQALQVAMEEHHYLLQAVLYSVALHHYGRLRIEDYDYDQHFGGMHYLFLRGMHPDFDAHGVYAYRPPRVVVENLSAIFGNPSAHQVTL